MDVTQVSDMETGIFDEILKINHQEEIIHLYWSTFLQLYLSPIEVNM